MSRSSGTELAVVPGTGEVFDLTTIEGAAAGLAAAASLYYQLRSFQEQARNRLREESDRRGQRTIHEGRWKVEVESIESSEKPVYDIDKLWDGLQAAGVPLERLKEAIHYEPKVDGTVVRQLAKNPIYRDVIEGATLQRVSKVRSVRVTEA